MKTNYNFQLVMKISAKHTGDFFFNLPPERAKCMATPKFFQEEHSTTGEEDGFGMN